MEETLQERQSDELEVLKAIFLDQCKDCNEEFKEWRPLNVIITIYPQKRSNMIPEVYVQLDLHVIATEEYPEKEPKIMLKNSKGLSDKQINDMISKLEQLASTLKGEVMVFELTQYIQSVLTDYNKPGFESFYEEMLSRQREKKQKEVQLKKTEEDIQRQLIDLKVKELKKERKRNKKTTSSHVINEAPASNNGNLQRKQSVSKNITGDAGNPKLENNCRPIHVNTHHKDPTTANNQLGIIVPLPNDSSRISREFEISDFIGKGAYGDVLKVRNKLDDCLYAIKRIHLNAKNRQLNRKIMREVKLLSRLNHENVVRYYNSWLEESFGCAADSSHTDLNYSNDVKINPVGNKGKQTNNIRLPPQKENLSFSFPRPNLDPSFSDDDDDDDDDDCDWISFMSNSSKTPTDDTDSSSVYQKNIRNNEMNETIVDQYLYIQMEYCEKSTLRTAIDNNLYLDEERVWRLLREIVEGLAYIHQQGIIHRDLKPVNIFIDSEDHVKIGDFGLATPNKHTVAVKSELSLADKADEHDSDFQPGMSDASHTGQIGTALYLSPELNSNDLSVVYNQKVDIYSLGVIFFEMCYKPLNTEMERIMVLTNLRQYSRNLPADFLKPEYDRQIKLIRDLLNHNPKERPSAEEILQNNEYIPATDMADVKFIDTIRHTLTNPQSKAYKHLISECFNQKVSVAENIIFDNTSYGKSIWYHSLIEEISQVIKDIFQLHGGTYLSTPLLMPDSKNCAEMPEGSVCLMTKSGALVNMPYDLRMPFARYLAQNPLIIHLKRYAIDKVYRERRMFGTHPKEMFECSFDIVSSLPYNLSVEAELLSVAYECLQKFPMLNTKNYLIRLNHTSLVTGILLHCRIKFDKHAYICDWLGRNRFQTGGNFDKTLISEDMLSKVLSIMDTEVPLNTFSDHFNDILKRQSASASQCKHAIHQLQMLAKLLGHLDIRCPIVIAPNLITNIQDYSGIMFQVVWNNKKDGKNRNERDIIATGGRYDPLIIKYRKTLNINQETTQTAAGISIFVDRLTTVLQTNLNLMSTIDVLVCSVGESDMIEEKLKIVKNLWSAGIRSTILNTKQSLEETQSYCKEINIPHIIFVKEAEIGIARVRSILKDRFCEKKMPVAELVDYLQKTIRYACPFQNSNSISNNTNAVSNAGNYVSQGSPHHYGRTESKTYTRMINIIFLTEEKYTNNNKRRYENQISNTISSSITKISPKSKIDVLALNVEGELIKHLITHIDLNTKNDFTILMKQFPRYKKDLKRLNNYLDELHLKDSVYPIIILYSLSDSTFKLII